MILQDLDILISTDFFFFFFNSDFERDDNETRVSLLPCKYVERD